MDIPFVNDIDAIGKWEYFDVIQKRTEFSNVPKNKFNDRGFKEIYFFPNGEPYWVFEGWTKGMLLTHEGGNAPIISNKYSIEKIDDKKYMFLEVNADTPYINVLKKTSDKEYTINEIGLRDNIDLPFVYDENILGLWKSICYVSNINDFNPNNTSSDLWLKSVCFKNDGTTIRIYDDKKWFDFWTKDVLIDKKKITASAYEIKLIENKQYLFMEWKMGNYVYAGMEPEYYVFERIK